MLPGGLCFYLRSSTVYFPGSSHSDLSKGYFPACINPPMASHTPRINFRVLAMPLRPLDFVLAPSLMSHHFFCGSVRSSQTGLFAIPCTQQAQLHPAASALVESSAWNTARSHICMAQSFWSLLKCFCLFFWLLCLKQYPSSKLPSIPLWHFIFL